MGPGKAGGSNGVRVKGVGTQSWWRSFVRSIGLGSFLGGGLWGSIPGGSFASSLIGGRSAHNPSGPQKKRQSGKPRIMMLISDTGGGHRASARAVKEAIESLYGAKYDISIVDLWKKHTPWPYDRMPDSYSTLVKYPILWRISFNLFKPKLTHIPYLNFMSHACHNSIAQAFEEYDPDLVVSLHPLMQHACIQILERMERKTGKPRPRFATVVTDLTTCHPTWFHPRLDRLFVATEYCRDRAIEYGVAEEKIVVHGLPIRPAFSNPSVSKEKLRKQLKLKEGTPAVLLVGGGEGMGPVEKTVRALAKHVGAKCQVVVICGRNQALVDKLSAIDYPKGMNVIVNGFVSNMDEWMTACDAIITKAGPGTIAEALAVGCPILLNAFVPCQEEGNIPHVVENEVGDFEPNSDKAAQVVGRWFTDPEKLAELSRRAKALGAPQATFNIARDLIAMLSMSAEELRAPSGTLAMAA
ncbi:unnamed protein product [Pedinophyceae sp. YPF-701]|nr:unnamed protein product [Pedinophyceae sp. YPF-701]